MSAISKIVNGFIYHGSSDPHATRNNKDQFGSRGQHKLEQAGLNSPANSLSNPFPREQYVPGEVNAQSQIEQQMRQLRGR